MSDNSAPDPAAMVLKMIAGGFLAFPPSILLQAFTRPGPVNWQFVFVAFITCYIVGIILFAVSFKWPKIKPRLPADLALSISKIRDNAYFWIVALAIFASGPPIIVASVSDKANPKQSTTRALTPAASSVGDRSAKVHELTAQQTLVLAGMFANASRGMLGATAQAEFRLPYFSRIYDRRFEPMHECRIAVFYTKDNAWLGEAIVRVANEMDCRTWKLPTATPNADSTPTPTPVSDRRPFITVGFPKEMPADPIGPLFPENYWNEALKNWLREKNREADDFVTKLQIIGATRRSYLLRKGLQSDWLIYVDLGTILPSQ